jgi:hypothetical protein
LVHECERPDDDDVAVRARVLALHALEFLVAADDQVEVPVLAVGDRDLVAAPDQVRRDHDFS